MLPQVLVPGFGESEVHAGEAGVVTDAGRVGVTVRGAVGDKDWMMVGAGDSMALDLGGIVDEETSKLPSEGANGIVA